MGGKAADGTAITAKYVGNRRLIETAVATLATDRALLLLGLPGTAKSWVSEHLAAAISGSSQRMIQCTAGTDENQIRYGWNYALLLAKGPSREALVKTPLTRAMEEGTIVRLEELTRMGSGVQDTLITILSEKTLPVSELDEAIEVKRGFNVIATANNRDKGVNDLSSALKRRFNVVVLPSPATLEEETGIVVKRVLEIGSSLKLPPIRPANEELVRVVTLFRELRDGRTLNGKTKLKSPSGSLSTAEAISVGVSAWASTAHFGNGKITAESLATNVIGAVAIEQASERHAEEGTRDYFNRRPCRPIQSALVADLPETAASCIEQLQAIAVNSSDITDLMNAISPLVRVLRYSTARGLPEDALRALILSISVEINAAHQLARFG